MKNIKINKKALSLLTAGVLMSTPVIANADGNNEEKSFTLVKQEMKVEGLDLNIDNYLEKLEKSYNYLKQYINYDYLQADLQILYYMANRTYMSTSTNDELIANYVVYSEDYIKENFHRAFGLINLINEYNENTIRNDYLNGTMDINHLIDTSVLCFDNHDQKIVRSMFEHYFNAYKNNLYENDEYISVFKELTTLNAEEREHNAHSLATGAMWLSQITIGRETIELLHDDMLRDYTIEELSKYFIREELENGNWILRDDVALDLNCMSELECEIFNLGELETFCYDQVNNNIYKIFKFTGMCNEVVENNEVVETIECSEEVENTETKECAEVVEESTNVCQEDYSFEESIVKALEYLNTKVSYDHLQSDLQCLSYLTNRTYLDSDYQKELIDSGIVYETNFETEEGLQNFMQAYSLINIILDYNQSVIQKDYANGTMDIEHLVDPSVICMNACDRNIVHNMHVEYFNAYKNNRFENQNYYNVLKELIGNNELSIGAMWLARNIVGGDTMQLLRDDMQEDFERKELDQFFDKGELNKGQWYVREDISVNADSNSELEREVYNFKTLWPFVYDDVNNDLFETFGMDCTNTK